MDKKPCVFISTPCLTGKCDVNFTTSLISTCAKLGMAGIPHGFEFMVGKKVDMARNLMAKTLLDNEQFTHIFFVDDDMGWSSDLLLRLLALDLPIVGVPARKRTETVLYNLRIPPTSVRAPDRNDVVEVEFIGTGIMLIKREVFEYLQQKVPVCAQSGRKINVPMLFHTSLVKNLEKDVFEERGEDVHFCHLARAHGIPVYAYLDEDVAHVGEKAYIGNYADVLGADTKGRSFKSADTKEPLRVLTYE